VNIVPLLRRLLADFIELGKEELALARAEMSSKLRSLVVGGVLLAAATVLVIVALLVATTAAILALTLVVAPWLAALIVMATYLLVAVVCALAGRANLTRAIPPVPTQSIENVKENLLWAKTLTTLK